MRLQRKAPLLRRSLQETAILLLIGTTANLLALTIDTIITNLVHLRARLSQATKAFAPSYLLWISSALIACALAVAACQNIAPTAAGSGIPQMKCVLGGLNGMKAQSYLSLRTMAAKLLSLTLALTGGLSVGKEGPYVHITACAASYLCTLRPFRRLNEDESLRRQVLAAACATGVSATFGAPVGGVLFSVEVTSTYYSVAHLWKSIFASVCGALVFRASRDGSAAAFGITKFTSMEHGLYNGEIFAFALLGVLCGLLGAFFVHGIDCVVRSMRELRALVETRLALASSTPEGRSLGPPPIKRLQRLVRTLVSDYGYTLLVGFLSATLTFPFHFFRQTPQEVMDELFGEHNAGPKWAEPSLVANLLIFIVCKFAFTIVAVTCPISCGVFTPVFLIGAATGRLFGECVDSITSADHNVIAGGYAVVGAAAMAAGVTRTVSTSVIIFELTGQLNHMLPVLVAVILATGVGNFFNKSIYDTMMALNKLPYIEPLFSGHDDDQVTAADIMSTSYKALKLPATHLDAYTILQEAISVDEFALIDSNGTLIGAVCRSKLQTEVMNRLVKTDSRTKRTSFAVRQLREMRDALSPHWERVRGAFNTAQVATESRSRREIKQSSSVPELRPAHFADEFTMPRNDREFANASPVSVDDLSETALSQLSESLDLGFELDADGVYLERKRGAFVTDGVKYAPDVVLGDASLQTLHRHFSMLLTPQLYVTSRGSLMGVIHRSQFTKYSNFEKRA